MKKNNVLILLIVIFTSNLLFAQSNEAINVNPNTGIANTVIQLYSLSRGSVVFPVSLGYSSKGVKVKDGSGNAGMGWNMVVGGRITRNLRGLPDDRIDQGWLYTNNGSKVANFVITNDNNTSTCNDESSDLNYLNTNFVNNTDTEPDIFSITAPGLSCDFIFDSNHQIKTMPYEDLKITYTTSYDGKIASFTVLNDLGITYTFSLVETISRSVSTNNINQINFFKTNYHQYKNSVTFNGTWNLTSMKDAGGNGVSLNYQSAGVKTGSAPLILIQSSPGNIDKKVHQYRTTEVYNNPFILSSVRSAKDTAVLDFDYRSFNAGETMLISRIIGGGRTINFIYEKDEYFSKYGRPFLTQVIDPLGTNPMNYKFGYANYNNFSTIPDTTLVLPDTASKQIDYWGYYTKIQRNTTLNPSLLINSVNPNYSTYKIQASAINGTIYTQSIPGAGRTADPDRAMTGTLNRITYPEGGTTTIEYELNDYIDPTTNSLVKGGGIRVKSLTNYDGINISNNTVTAYSYVNPATQTSSGRPLTLPIYAFTRPWNEFANTVDKWTYSTVKSENDLNPEDNSILYSHVKVNQFNAGSILYEYATGGALWDVNTITDWSPTINYIARPNCSTADFTKNDIFSYPFAPNTNYDFERGLLKKKVNYNKDGQEVSESVFNYIRTDAPIVVSGLRIDSNMTSKVYSKYNIYTNCNKLISQETKKVFDSQTLSQPLVSTLNYYYQSQKHKLQTAQTATNSDGSISSTLTTYIKDYVIPVTSNLNLQAIQQLQLLNVNIPVERLSTVQRNNVTRVVRADLTEFSSSPGKFTPFYMPSRNLSFVSVNGVTDFQTFTPNSGNIVKDDRYIPVTNLTKYDIYGFLQTKDDNNKNVNTVFTDRFVGKPAANILNAAYDEVAFNDFDSRHNGNSFVYDLTTPYVFTKNSHTGVNALLLNAGTVLSTTIRKSNQTSVYIYSCWLNTSSSGEITISINNNDTITPYSLPYVNNSGNWKYYELKIPAVNLSSTISVTVKSNMQIIIDDILLYPEQASIESFTYDISTRQKSSETTVNGITTYYSYDPYGRLLWIKDQDKQIRLKKSYVRKTDIINAPPFVSMNFTTFQEYSSYQPGKPINFENRSLINNIDADDIIYTWNYGDGTPIVTGNNTIHIFAAVGTYTINLTATSAKFGQRSISYATTISPVPPATVNLSYTNLSNGGNITSIVFMQGSTVISSTKGAIIALGGSYAVGQPYTIKVTISGTSNNYNSFTYNGSSKICFAIDPGSSTNTYTFNDNLLNLNSVNFKIDVNTCGSGAISPN